MRDQCKRRMTCVVPPMAQKRANQRACANRGAMHEWSAPCALFYVRHFMGPNTLPSSLLAGVSGVHGMNNVSIVTLKCANFMRFCIRNYAALL